MKTHPQTMQIFAVVGSLGAGKTTFVRRIIISLSTRSGGKETRGKLAYIINDEGSLVDGQNADESAQVVAMTNGCFTCQDTADLERILRELQASGFAWAFLEGFGLTSGNETLRFLESCGHPFHVMCLLSAMHHGRDLVRYSDVVRSQVRAATFAVGITKHDGDSLLDERAPVQVLDFVARERPGIQTLLIGHDSPIPTAVLYLFDQSAIASTTPRILRSAGAPAGPHAICAGDHDTSCDHCHACDHGRHVHNAYLYSFQLKNTIAFEEVRRAFGGMDFLLRIKGAIGGSLFNEVHGQWEETAGDSRAFVTFYASRKVNIEQDLPLLVQLISNDAMTHDMRPSYAQLREETASREATVTEIEGLLEEFPTAPTIIVDAQGSRMITHPEKLQIAKEISRRPSVIDEWFPIVLLRCMEYWIKCAKLIIESPERIIPEDIDKNRYELAVSMTWWTKRYGTSFGDEIVREVDKLGLGIMAATGISTLQSLIPITPPETVSWQCLEFTEALRHGLERDEDRETIIKAARHCLSLAATPELRQAWSNSIDELEATPVASPA